MLLLSFFNDFPEFIGKDIYSLVKLVLSSFIFAKIRELITEVIKVFDKLL